MIRGDREAVCSGTFCMTERIRARACAAGAACRVGPALSGCMGSPTYGTDKTANEQLVDDLSSMLFVRAEEQEPDRLQAASRHW